MRQWIDLVLDSERLSELTGRSVVADRLRIKPDTSIVIGLRSDDGGADGWARLLWPPSQVKATKVAERAERRGQRVESTTVGDGLLLQWGELAADPLLAAPLRTAVAEGLASAVDEVLRYNPLRRLVLKRGDETVRVFTHADPVALPLDWTLAEAGVPIPGRLDDGSHPQSAVQRFVGDADLATHPDLGATREAGAALAALHSVRLPSALREALGGRAPEVLAQGRAHARLLRPLDAGLAERAAALATRTASVWFAVGGGHETLVHGDASPDQMILDTATGQTWITDLERACLAEPAVDLGSYLASSSDEEGQALLEGYAAAGGAVPSASVLGAARARAMLLTLVDPLRRAQPNWPAQVSARLDALEDHLR